MSWMTGGGQPIPAGLSYPPPKTCDCVQIMKMTFKCYISENDETTILFRHFLHVCNNQSVEMSWMTGGGQPIPAGLSYPPPPHDFKVNLYMDEFQEMGFCIVAGSICILWNKSIYCC